MEQYVGKNIIRPDGYDKATGRAKYAADYKKEDMLYAVVVHSKKTHAKILNIDITKAKKEAYVFTALDLANNEIVDIINDRPVFADKVVRFMGEAIAVVAADSLEQANYAASLVEVTYEDLPVYIDPVDALKEGAVPIGGTSNLVGSFENTKGDMEKGFNDADLILEHIYTVPHQEHAYMEPDANFSYMDGDSLIVKTSSQSAFNDQRMISHALGLDLDKVVVESATVGGAFGGKDGHMTQIFGALVTYKTKRPTKIVFTRQESMAYTFKRHSANIHLKMGFKKNGQIVAFDSDTIIDTGAYIGYGYTVLGLLSEHISGPYDIPNIHINSKLVYTNTTVSSAFRGFGAPQGSFACESMISEAASILHLDPLEMRYINALETGKIGAVGQVITASCGLKEALQIVKESKFWQERTNKKANEGYGIACGYLSCGFGKSIPDKAQVKLLKNGDCFELYIGFTEIGQGAITSMQSIAAEALNVDVSKIKMIQSNTKTTFDCGSTAASRSTFIGGNAIIKACKEYLERAASGEKNIEVITSADFPEPTLFKSIGMPHAMYTYAVQAFKVVVNKITGKADVVDALAVTEAGKVINPMQLAGQINGGMLQSIGYATMENIQYLEDGTLINDSFTTYNIPTFMDAPHMNSLFVDGYEPTGPNGAKGAAESPTVPTAGAINAAIFDATGIWHYNLPITNESNIFGDKEKN